jgi:hypothetical protein
MILKLASCDSQGSVYLDKLAVYRLVNASHAEDVLEVLNLVSGGVAGVVETEACLAETVPVDIDAGESSLVLKHRRIERISYPHEWCAVMLQDAAVFQMKLAERLLERGLFLKDAHPWNILYERGCPVFVDFTSIVTKAGLCAESYLGANRRHCDLPSSVRIALLVKEIFVRMYQPYFISPLLLYACGGRARVRIRIENTTLNASTDTITWREAFPFRHTLSGVWRRFRQFLSLKFKEIKILTELRTSDDVARFYAGVIDSVEKMRVAVGGSAYAGYYRQKGEDQRWTFSNDWNAKQKSVHDALNSPDLRSVTDIACNTGWYALMAEKLGKSVVAFDIDEGCVEALYTEVRNLRLNVLPLVMDLTQMSRDRYSIYDGKKVLINAVQRFESDSVLALGIIHHLALGLGLGFDYILDLIVPLARKQVIIEFVDLNDAMIEGEPSFFPAYFKDSSISSGYQMHALIDQLIARGFEVSLRASHPDTRKLLVCNREGQK